MIYIKPNIKLDSNIPSSLSYNYEKNYLSKKIESVCSKVGFSYKGITWIIFDPKIADIYGKKTCTIEKPLIGLRIEDYGGYSLDNKEIFIPTLPIRKEILKEMDKDNPLYDTFKNILDKNENKYSLTDLILYGITHFKIKSSHLNKEFYSEFDNFKKSYYKTLF